MDVQTRHPVGMSVPFPSSRPVASIGFGFGVSTLAPPTLASSSTSIAQKASPIPSSPRQNPSKRRYEPDQQEDENMVARSPSPDRPKKLSKRMRVEVGRMPTSPNSKTISEPPQDTVDVGMLLASLPPSSLLPIITSLIAKHPGLKQLIVPLIPRPSLDATLQTLAASIKTIRDAYPYSQPTPLSTSFGFGLSSVPSSRDSSPAIGSSGRTNGMRDTYIQNRIRFPVAEFASTARSYLVYFTSLPSETQSFAQQNASSTPSPSADLSHPSESFAYLRAVVMHIHKLPPIARNLIYAESSGLLIRLHREWVAWLDRIDEHVNRSGGMYGEEAVRAWERGLDEMVASEDRDVKDGLSVTVDMSTLGLGEMLPPRPLRALRDAWITKVGWLIGRRSRSVPDGMDEDEL